MADTQKEPEPVKAPEPVLQEMSGGTVRLSSIRDRLENLLERGCWHSELLAEVEALEDFLPNWRATMPNWRATSDQERELAELHGRFSDQERELAELHGRFNSLARDHAELARRAAHLDSENQHLRSQNSKMRNAGRTLVDGLRDAWWVQTADALRTMEVHVKDDQWLATDENPF